MSRLMILLVRFIYAHQWVRNGIVSGKLPL